MKKLFIPFAVFTTMFLFIACGGDENSESESNTPCTAGEFKCIGNESHYCNSLGSLVYDARCENGCDSSTGKCNTNSDNNNGNGSDSNNSDTDSGDFSDSANDNTDSDTNTNTDTEPCTEEGAFRCNGNLQQECTYGYWRTLRECEYDCDPVTQKCLGATECKTGTYECIAGNSSYCNNNFWEIKEICQYGCSEGKCLPEDCYTTRIYTCGDSKESGFSYASYYCEYGSWNYDKTCQGDCDKSTGKCKAVCTSGEYKCEGNDSMRCKDGFWVKSTTCTTYGCDLSTGRCKLPECFSSDEYKCSGNISMRCKDGFWENNKSCVECNESTGKCKCSTISGKTWSDESANSMTWQNAKDYCDNLTECGYSDWRLPTISELRTLIQNCPATETGGECGVTDSCLSSSECSNNACIGCGYDSSDKYSKLGDRTDLWSSSVTSDYSNDAWFTSFLSGQVYHYSKTQPISSVRCVR